MSTRSLVHIFSAHHCCVKNVASCIKLRRVQPYCTLLLSNIDLIVSKNNSKKKVGFSLKWISLFTHCCYRRLFLLYRRIIRRIKWISISVDCCYRESSSSNHFGHDFICVSHKEFIHSWARIYLCLTQNILFGESKLSHLLSVPNTNLQFTFRRGGF